MPLQNVGPYNISCIHAISTSGSRFKIYRSLNTRPIWKPSWYLHKKYYDRLAIFIIYYKVSGKDKTQKEFIV